MPLTKIALCAAIVGATLCVPIAAQAQAPRYYIGASFGRMDTNINDASFAATRISVKDRDNAWKLYGGGNFNRHIGVEAGYVDLGTVRVTSAAPVSATVKIKGIGLALVGTMPVNDRLAFFGKAGGFHSYQRETLTVGTTVATGKNRQLESLIGIGVKYDVTPNFSLRLEGERFGLGDGDYALYYSLGAQYNF